MSELRRRMQEEMVVRGFAAHTQESYVRAIAQLARHYGCSPKMLIDGQLHAWLVHLVIERKLAYASVNQAASAMRFLYRVVLQREVGDLAIPMAKVPQRLPEVLSREELARLHTQFRRYEMLHAIRVIVSREERSRPR